MGRCGSIPQVRELVDVLLAPPAEAQDRFAGVMREMFECAQDGALSAALNSESSVRLLSQAWRDRPESAHAANRSFRPPLICIWFW